MEKYRISVKKSAQKELEAIPKNLLQNIIKRIQGLAANPRPPGSQKLSHSVHYRIRQGDYRIVYLVLDDSREVEIYKIGHRREVYKS
jgi:mRNA interferase RelE/StbE